MISSLKIVKACGKATHNSYQKEFHLFETKINVEGPINNEPRMENVLIYCSTVVGNISNMGKWHD